MAENNCIQIPRSSIHRQNSQIAWSGGTSTQGMHTSAKSDHYWTQWKKIPVSNNGANIRSGLLTDRHTDRHIDTQTDKQRLHATSNRLILSQAYAFQKIQENLSINFLSILHKNQSKIESITQPFSGGNTDIN